MKSILIVEDEKMILDVLRQVFEDAGYVVSLASSLEAGVEMMCLQEFDILLSDRNLVPLDPFAKMEAVRLGTVYIEPVKKDVTQMLKEVKASKGFIPSVIVYMSSDFAIESADKILEAYPEFRDVPGGFVHYIAKPFLRVDPVQIVQRAVEQMGSCL